jgi:hypothetical protein
MVFMCPAFSLILLIKGLEPDPQSLSEKLIFLCLCCSNEDKKNLLSGLTKKISQEYSAPLNLRVSINYGFAVFFMKRRT